MARTKKLEAPPPPPKHPRDVKHGCCSCKYYKLDSKEFPCRPCEKFNYWEDAQPGKLSPALLSESSVSETSASESEQTVNGSPARSSRANKTAVSSEVSFDAEKASGEPIKRGRKPKSEANASSLPENEPMQTIPAPAKKTRKPRKKDADISDLPIPEQDQLSLI